MGILKHADVFTHKYITAIVKDSSGRGHIRHIKHTLGDYWLTEIERQMYCFKIEDSRIITYKETAARSCRILEYSTKHYKPISPENNKELEDVLRENSLPRMNMMMFGAFKMLSQKEKEKKGEPFAIHQLPQLIEVLAKGGERYQAQSTNLKTYFDNLAISQIVTPVKEITEFIEDDLIATDPKFLGDVVSTCLQLDKEHKKVTNAKVDAKKPWLLIAALCVIVGGIAFMGFYMINQGGTGGLGNLFPQIVPNNQQQGAGGTGKLSDQEVFAKYPTPEALNGAIAKGDIKMEQLSPNVQKLVKNYKPP